MRKREIRENRENNVKDSADTYKNGTGKPFSFKNIAKSKTNFKDLIYKQTYINNIPILPIDNILSP